ncbi:MAG: DedA family protein [Deltaproteobacteria bacterium]|nr:DedA family protein [Deltaproteobacteria bacterium]
MEYLKLFIDIVLHLDVHLSAITDHYGLWTYAILFLIIFCETGLVVAPFLPGDSLLFAVGSLAAIDSLRLDYLLVFLTVAAVLGDTVNYGIGRFMGPRVFAMEDSRVFKREYMDRTRAFYEKYGGKTIIFARFVPIIRTFAPFVAGVGAMKYRRFIFFNVAGGAAWIGILVCAGYFFGALSAVKKNFTMVIFIIIIISITPGIIEYLRHHRGGAGKGAGG